MAVTREQLVAELVRNRIWQLKQQLRAQEGLSRPVPQGRWRWADVASDGYRRKTDEELAADRARAAQRVTEIRAELALLEETGEPS